MYEAHAGKFDTTHGTITVIYLSLDQCVRFSRSTERNQRWSEDFALTICCMHIKSTHTNCFTLSTYIDALLNIIQSWVQ